MASPDPKKCCFSRFFRTMARWFSCGFREKNELLKQIEEYKAKIASLENEICELKRENNDLESRMENYKKNSDKIDFIGEFGSVEKIIQKAEEYDKNENLIKDLEMENRKLEQENRKLKSLI